MNNGNYYVYFRRLCDNLEEDTNRVLIQDECGNWKPATSEIELMKVCKCSDKEAFEKFYGALKKKNYIGMLRTGGDTYYLMNPKYAPTHSFHSKKWLYSWFNQKKYQPNKIVFAAPNFDDTC